MPRAYTQVEQDKIRARLLEAGRERFAAAGLHKTSVAELAAAASIGKGSFYLFYPCKEALFFAVQLVEERRFKDDLVRELATAHGAVERIETLLLVSADRLHRHPFLRRLLDPSVLDALAARLPDEVAKHQREDQAFFVELGKQWRRDGTLPAGTKPELVFDLLFAIFALSLQRPLLGEERFERVIRYTAASLAHALAGP